MSNIRAEWEAVAETLREMEAESTPDTIEEQAKDLAEDRADHKELLKYLDRIDDILDMVYDSFGPTELAERVEKELMMCRAKLKRLERMALNN